MYLKVCTSPNSILLFFTIIITVLSKIYSVYSWNKNITNMFLNANVQHLDNRNYYPSHIVMELWLRSLSFCCAHEYRVCSSYCELKNFVVTCFFLTEHICCCMNSSLSGQCHLHVELQGELFDWLVSKGAYERETFILRCIFWNYDHLLFLNGSMQILYTIITVKLETNSMMYNWVFMHVFFITTLKDTVYLDIIWITVLHSLVQYITQVW